MDNINPKLLKIIALAKGGVGGERTTAIELVQQICRREGLDFDAVMSDSGDLPKEYETDIKVRSKDELRIAIQVAARFATTPENPDVRGGYYGGQFREIWIKYTCTAAAHIDTLNAIDVYLKAYRKEKQNILEALKEAFTAKHSLYPQFDSEDDEPPKERTAAEKLKTWRAANVMQGLTENVNLRKQIGE